MRYALPDSKNNQPKGVGHMKEGNEVPGTVDEPKAAPPARGRRRLLQGGVGAAPLLMTLVSRPVLGHGFQCTTPSGFVSMPTSGHGQPLFCDGLSPGFWKQPHKFDEWPKPFYPVKTKSHAATTFSPFFSHSPYPAGTTFLQVLETMAGPPHSVARHIVASVLNVASGRVPTTVLSIPLIKTIWTDYRTKGYFEPTAGVKWYHDEIQNYLASTFS